MISEQRILELWINNSSPIDNSDSREIFDDEAIAFANALQAEILKELSDENSKK